MRLGAFVFLLSMFVVDSTLAQETKTACRSAGRSEWARPVELNDVADFKLHRVSAGFYRSAQPSKEAFAALVNDVGIRTVVSLRALHSDEPLMRGLPVHLATRIPMHTWHIEREDVVRALREVRRGSQQSPVLLHCQHGADRTGLITALYRILYENWCKEAAIAEMKEGGFGFHAEWGNIPTFIENVDVERLRRDVGTQ